MKVVFADSTFYVALLLSRDSNHENAVNVARSWSDAIVTTEYVLTEVANHLSASRIGRATFGVFLADLQADSKTQIIDSSPDLWQRGVDLYLNRADKQWSLTDCVFFVVMRERKITDSLTADHHFEQAGFSAHLV